MTAHRSQSPKPCSLRPSSPPELPNEPAHFVLEPLSSLRVVAKHVKTRARRREQHHPGGSCPTERRSHRVLEAFGLLDVDRIRKRLPNARSRFTDRDDR